jgi:hypothetical protein
MSLNSLQNAGFPSIRDYVALSGSMADNARQIRAYHYHHVEGIMSASPSPGYEPLLIKRGDDPVIARLKARIFLHEGKKLAAESQRRREVVHAIRVLARPKHSPRAIVKSLKVIVAAWRETWVLRTIFTEAGLNDDLFVQSIGQMSGGDINALQMVLHIAANSAPKIKLPRGPKLTAASATHELFLESQVRCTARAYTYSEYDENFVDEATKATRLEFGDERFSPRSAWRRLKARRRLAASATAEPTAQGE